MIILFRDGPIAGLQLETNTPPVIYNGALADKDSPPDRAKWVDRHWDDYQDPWHEQFRYEFKAYVMDAGGQFKAIIYQWVESQPEKEIT
jgi:hypothetical protein